MQDDDDDGDDNPFKPQEKKNQTRAYILPSPSPALSSYIPTYLPTYLHTQLSSGAQVTIQRFMEEMETTTRFLLTSSKPLKALSIDRSKRFPVLVLQVGRYVGRQVCR